ncbi:hypothetical protein [Methylobacterium marchantiae]|uniref:DUF2474 domain-containing protein n=1 Tax=Methylobacterium marchantiae TaxID=600331 RepID=A0ABW3WW33_9HYPH|nr:hypothetical protein AIGOOFII_1275 [Methylobacterium marchantiae]
MSDPRRDKPRTFGRLLWFVAFYATSLVAFTALVYLIRFIAKGS